MTSFYKIYNKFLAKITDDMYLELTPRDTYCDLRELLIDSIPGFEFPRKKLDYVLVESDSAEEIASQYDKNWNQGITFDTEENKTEFVLNFDTIMSEESASYFEADLTDEEMNILALLMMDAWVNRQVASVEMTRMKYSGADFKMTSQANHLSKLLTLKNETRRQAHHMQRLYRRRKTNDEGYIESNWSVLREVSALDY